MTKFSTEQVQEALNTAPNVYLGGYRYVSNGIRHFKFLAEGGWVELDEPPTRLLNEANFVHRSGPWIKVPCCH